MNIIGLIVALLISALVIFIVGKLGLGLEVSGFGGAIIAAIVIAIVAAVVNWLLVGVLDLSKGSGIIGLTLFDSAERPIGVLGFSMGSDIIGTIVLLIVAAVVLLISDKFVPGLKVNGFGGAIIAAIAIAVVAWLINWLLGLLGLM